MAGPVRTRQSCDRCHGQKLRCPKQAGSAVCTRCQKAGTACVFNPPGWESANRPDAIQMLPDVQRHSIPTERAMDGDLSAPDRSFLPMLSPNDVRNMGPEPEWTRLLRFDTATPAQAIQMNTNTVAIHDPKSVCIRQLSEIMLELDAIWTSLPPRRSLHFPWDDNVKKHTAELSVKHSSDKLVGDFFTVSQRFTNLYLVAVELSLLLSPEEHVCNVPNCIHHLGLRQEIISAYEQMELRNSPNTIDLSMANLLVACHLRFLDILDRILALALSCFKISLNSHKTQEPYFNVPEMSVGSYTPTASMAVLAQFAMMRQLVQDLSRQANKFTEAVKVKMRGSKDKECRVLALQCEILQERQKTTVGQLKAVSDQVEKLE